MYRNFRLKVPSLTPTLVRKLPPNRQFSGNLPNARRTATSPLVLLPPCPPRRFTYFDDRF
ncbi:hypothetical protein PM082_006754 [Marasmius tenuissimus]|nr:hypothetical protein PM082_006754 [Marasmius tenuissimus]